MVLKQWAKLVAIANLQVIISANLIIAASAAVAEATAATVGSFGVATPALVAAQAWLDLCIAAHAAAVISAGVNEAGAVEAGVTTAQLATMKAKVLAIGATVKPTLVRTILADVAEKGFAYGPI